MTCVKDDHQRFLKPKCLDGTCTSCPGFAAVRKCGLEDERGTGVQFLRDKWAKGQHLLADGTTKDVHDFYSLPSDFEDLETDMEAYCQTLLQHHDLAIMQDYDWAKTQENFPRGHFCSVQDFSLAYTHTRRIKQQSLWFQNVTSSLYGACVRLHLDDISDTYIEPAERQKLKHEFAKKAVKPILTFTLIGVSADHGQDNAFVQNFNDRITAWVKSIAAPGTTFKVHHARSDGCRGQYKCAQHFYYVSRQQAETGIRMDWCFSCSCHGKDLVDPENGRAKNCARNFELNIKDNHELSLRDSEKLAAHLANHFIWPQRKLWEKAMRGIYRRVIWFIPTKGPGSVNRRVKHCNTLAGSNSMHQFEDIGRPGYLRVRDRSCHRCGQCWAGRSHECSEPGMEHFPALLVELDPYTPPERPLTRSALSAEGIALANTVEPGDFLAVEIDSLQTPWMMFRATSKVETYPGPEQKYWMGKVLAGDSLLWAHKMEGVGNTFTLTAEKSPIFVEDVRAVKLKMAAVNIYQNLHTQLS